ncbi:monooxygenase [Mycobacterium tuberculosis]|nr:monooxygenase [Mycobacterium tuberculosis]CMG71241.1 monooxygenase [Mycobacterium tuberculosis]
MHYEKDAKILLEDPIDDGVLHFAAAAQDHAAA